MSKAILQLDAVTKTFAAGDISITGISKCSLAILPGSFTCISGPSGSGKSTLLYMMGGLLTPDSGTVWLQGNSIYQVTVSVRARILNEKIGFIFQGFHLIPELTVLENCTLPLELMASRSSDTIPSTQIRREALVRLEAFGLGHRHGHYPSELSGGEQQRAAIVRSMINTPQLLLCDEPTGNLDSANAGRVWAALRQLHQAGQTMVVVSHAPEAMRYATHVYGIQDGHVTLSH